MKGIFPYYQIIGSIIGERRHTDENAKISSRKQGFIRIEKHKR